MKAVVRDAYGSVDVLRLGEVAKPVADEGEVAVRVALIPRRVNKATARLKTLRVNQSGLR